ncbi:MAG: TIGR00296 family protein [Nitrososphaerales archaeon]
MNLSDEDGSELVKLSRRAIESYVAENAKIRASADIAAKYGERAGVFVTLNSLGAGEEKLRGCIGFPMPEKMLYDAVIDAAIASATDDPRFRKVTPEELNEIAIELSVLTPPELIEVKDRRQYKERIHIGKDGLIVHWSSGSGLLLPQVPVEYRWDAEQFLCETCMKAGAMPDAWLYDGTKVYRFEAIVFKELAPEGSVVRVDLGAG